MKLYDEAQAGRPTEGKIQDQESKAMLFEGASVSQLATLFVMDNRTVAKKIFGIRPVGRRGGHPIYSIKEAAAFLVTPHGDMEQYLRRMNPADLPPMLSKEFWAGQHARLRFEEERGDLWRTEDVIGHYGETFKVLRTSIMLMVDQIERVSELSDAQREAAKTMTDGLMRDLNEKLIERFQNEPERDFEYQEAEGGGAEEPQRAEGALQERDPAQGL